MGVRALVRGGGALLGLTLGGLIGAVSTSSTEDPNLHGITGLENFSRNTEYTLTAAGLSALAFGVARGCAENHSSLEFLKSRTHGLVGGRPGGGSERIDSIV